MLPMYGCGDCVVLVLVSYVDTIYEVVLSTAWYSAESKSDLTSCGVCLAPLCVVFFSCGDCLALSFWAYPEHGYMARNTVQCTCVAHMVTTATGTRCSILIKR
jgi:hypothetical protein